METKTNKEKYEQLLDVLVKAEMYARNHQWATAGTACKLAMELAYKFHNQELQKIHENAQLK